MTTPRKSIRSHPSHCLALCFLVLLGIAMCLKGIEIDKTSRFFDDSGYDLNVPAISSKLNSTSPSDFISTWNTGIHDSYSSGSTPIRLPLISRGKYNFTVFWGDGTSDHITSWDQAAATHGYSRAGIYQVKISGMLKGWSFDVFNKDKLKLIEISQWGSINLGKEGEYFNGCANLVLSTVDSPNLTGVTDLNRMFFGCSSIGEDGNLEGWDVSNVHSMALMFFGASSFNQDLSGWDVSSVANMAWMFEGASSFNQDLGGWDVSNVTSMSGMFTHATLSSENYDSLLIGWASQNLQSNIRFNAGNSKFSKNAFRAHEILESQFNRPINDGGSIHPVAFFLFDNRLILIFVCGVIASCIIFGKVIPEISSKKTAAASLKFNTSLEEEKKKSS